jgi:hypothetical protein
VNPHPEGFEIVVEPDGAGLYRASLASCAGVGWALGGGLGVYGGSPEEARGRLERLVEKHVSAPSGWRRLPPGARPRSGDS